MLLLAGGAAAGWFGGRELDEAETVTETTTSTTTETAQSETGLPAAVEKTRAELLAAAETGDYEKLRELVPATGFEYTFEIGWFCLETGEEQTFVLDSVTFTTGN